MLLFSSAVNQIHPALVIDIMYFCPATSIQLSCSLGWHGYLITGVDWLTGGLEMLSTNFLSKRDKSYVFNSMPGLIKSKPLFSYVGCLKTPHGVFEDARLVKKNDRWDGSCHVHFLPGIACNDSANSLGLLPVSLPSQVLFTLSRAAGLCALTENDLFHWGQVEP